MANNKPLNVEELRKDIIYSLDYELDNTSLGAYAFDGYEGAYICDAIAEASDYNIDIYNEDLFEWAKGNYSIIEDAANELGACEDILQAIRQGQYYNNEMVLYNNLEDFLAVYVLGQLLDNDIKALSDEEWANLLFYVKGLDNNDRVPSFEDIKGALEC